MKRILLALALSCCVPAFPQDYVDILNFNYAYSPETGYDEGPGTTRVNSADFNLFLPIPLSERTAVIGGLMGTLNRLRPDPEAEPMALYSLSAVMGLNLQHSDNWSTLHLLFPRQASSLDFGRPRFQLGTLQLLQRQLAANKNISFGFYLNTEEFGLMIVPIVGYYYRDPDDRWEFTALMPSRGEINLRVTPRLRAGLAFDGLGNSFPIENEQFGKAYVQRASNDLSLLFRYRLTPSLLLSVRGGYAISRSFRIYAADDTVDISIVNIIFRDPRTILNASVKDGFLFGFQMKYRFHL